MCNGSASVSTAVPHITYRGPPLVLHLARATFGRFAVCGATASESDLLTPFKREVTCRACQISLVESRVAA